MGSRLNDPRRRRDVFFKRAKAERYPARSIFKLEEIDRRYNLLRPGMRVLDLGASPGSWLLYAAKQVGPGGKVVGIDRQTITAQLPANASALQADLLDAEPAELCERLGRFNLVLSDLAPNTTGIAFADQAKSVELFLLALRVAEATAIEHSAFTGKIFMGEGFEEALSATHKLFSNVRVARPKATRRESTELYIIGRDPTVGL